MARAPHLARGGHVPFDGGVVQNKKGEKGPRSLKTEQSLEHIDISDFLKAEHKPLAQADQKYEQSTTDEFGDPNGL